ncbi:MAG: PP2C family protein-serine/threonine phosphatase [Thermotogaceae bacterium]|nr:PP2C family protein-serine/threonine phosphatase [Thermotogaceae bacterium]
MEMLEDLREFLKRVCELSGNVINVESMKDEELIEKAKNCLNIVESEIKDYAQQLEELSISMEAQLEELSKTYEELATIFEVNKILGTFEYPYHLSEKIEKVLNVVKNAIPFKGVIIKLKTPDETVDYKEGYEVDLDSVEKKINDIGELSGVVLHDFSKETIFGKMNILIVPVRSINNYWGYIALVEKEQGIFTAADRKILESVSQQISSALDRIEFMKDEIERQRMKEQLEIARNIQLSLFPKNLPRTEKIALAATSVPAIHVGGDYYDAFRFRDGILAVVADVSGKGVPAALLMSSARAALRSISKTTNNLKSLIKELNNTLVEDLTDDRFITMIAMHITDDGKLTIVNAGHDPVYIVSSNGIREESAEDIPLGIISGYNYEEKVIYMPEGSFVVAYTDGVPEARNVKGEEFGFERLEEVLKSSSICDPENLMLRIKNAVFEFSKGASQHDDTTIMVIRYS